MKITINSDDEEVSISTKRDDLTASQVAELMFRISLANGARGFQVGTFLAFSRRLIKIGIRTATSTF